MIYDNLEGVPRFVCDEYSPRKTKYCLLIPIINEHGRIEKELELAKKHGIDALCDIIICDGGSTDGCTDRDVLIELGVNTLLTKDDAGGQGAQLRMGLWWALQRRYEGFITIDGNNKDSIEDVPRFISKLDEGCDFIQGSRFIEGGKAVNTPVLRCLAVQFIHAPLISLTAGRRYTDTTNGFRAYSRRYIEHPQVQPFRDVFMGYELLAYLSVRANQIRLSSCEIPVTRAYPKDEKTPTKISGVRENRGLFTVLVKNAVGRYAPVGEKLQQDKVKKTIRFLLILASIFIVYCLADNYRSRYFDTGREKWDGALPLFMHSLWQENQVNHRLSIRPTMLYKLMKNGTVEFYVERYEEEKNSGADGITLVVFADNMEIARCYENPYQYDEKHHVALDFEIPDRTKLLTFEVFQNNNTGWDHTWITRLAVREKVAGTWLAVVAVFLLFLINIQFVCSSIVKIIQVLAKSMKTIPRITRILAPVLLIALLVFVYQTNILLPNNTSFGKFDKWSEGLPLASILAARDNFGIDQKYGLLLLAPKGKPYDGGVLAFELYARAGTDASPGVDPEFTEYTSQVGLQGWVYYLAVKVVKWIGHSYAGMFRLLCRIALAVIAVFICIQIKRKYNFFLAFCFYITFLLSQWIVNFASHLYWVEFTWFVPMFLGLLVMNYPEKRRLIYILLFIAVLLKCLCGYEYITVIMLSSVMFLACEYVMQYKNSREKRKQTAAILFHFGIISVAAFFTALTIHALLRGNGNLAEGFISIFKYTAMRRIVGAEDGVNNAAINVSIFTILKTYTKFYTPVLSILPTKTFFLLLGCPIIMFFLRGARLLPKNSFELPLYIISLPVCISWFVLAKAHSFFHTHLNFVLWYFGFVQVSLYIIGKFLGELVTRWTDDQ
jgi:dolichol-phosphate mannosyltransferase